MRLIIHTVYENVDEEFFDHFCAQNNLTENTKEALYAGEVIDYKQGYFATGVTSETTWVLDKNVQ